MQDACTARREVYCQSSPSALLTQGLRLSIDLEDVTSEVPPLCSFKVVAVRRLCASNRGALNVSMLQCSVPVIVDGVVVIEEMDSLSTAEYLRPVWLIPRAVHLTVSPCEREDTRQ